MLRELLDGPDWAGYHLEGQLMLADLGTKGVPADRVRHLMQLMGLHRPVSAQSTSSTSPRMVKHMLAMTMIIALVPETEALGN